MDDSDRSFLFQIAIAVYGWGEPGKKDNGFQKVNDLIDFSDYNDGAVDKWLRDKGFECVRDARDRRKLHLGVKEVALILEAQSRLTGFLIPNTPYFIGFFLGKDDEVNKPYVGRYFQKAGRYVCLGNPKPVKL